MMKSRMNSNNGLDHGQLARPPPVISRILSGSMGSIVYILALTPLEVVKVRQQTAGSIIGCCNSAASSMQIMQSPVKAFLKGRGAVMLNNGLILPKSAFPCLEAPQYRVSPTANMSMSTFIASSAHHNLANKPGQGILSTLLSISRTEGRAGLYAGLRPSLLVAVPNTAIYFTAYDDIILYLRRNHAAVNNESYDGTATATTAKQHLYMPLVAGATARLISSLATAPLELVRTRQASSINHSKSILEEFRSILRTNGALGLYKGLGPMVLRDVPFSALYFLSFDTFKNSLSTSNYPGAWGVHFYQERGMKPPAGVEVLQALVSGAAAGTIATILTTPFDVVKTQRQSALESQGGRLNATANANQGMVCYMRQIVKQEGLFAGLWKGNQTRMMKVVPGHAIMIACYEFGKRFLEDAV